MQHRSSMLGHFNYSSCQRPDPPCASCIFRCCAFRENNTATFPSYFHTPFSSHRDNSPPFLKKKSSFHVLLIQKQKKESGNTRFHTARIKYLMLERKKNGWKVAHGETSWNGKVHPVYLSLSRPSAPAISARSNIGGVAASATLHSAGVALRLLT